MSVLIRGMEMPKSCWFCNFCRAYDEPNQGFFCVAIEADLHRSNIQKKRSDDCPLVEVPTPHGDLIDREVMNCKDCCQDCQRIGCNIEVNCTGYITN